MKCNYKFVFERLNSNANKFINQSINQYEKIEKVLYLAQEPSIQYLLVNNL